MSTNNFTKSDINSIYNIVQSSMLVYPKELIINTLKDLFSKESFYHYSRDQWGFANTTDHTDLPPGADIPIGHPGSTASSNTLLSTRIFIGERYRVDGIYYPAILVYNTGTKYVPISINREKGSIQYEDTIYEDGYGNQTKIKTPKSFITAGVWEGTVAIDVMTRSLVARDQLVETIGMCFTELTFEELYDVGLIIKPITVGGTSEVDDRADKLFRQTLTLDVRTEWRREVPISSIVEAILFTVNFQDLADPNKPAAANLTINTQVSFTDMLLNL
jgi:hypothetical protein